MASLQATEGYKGTERQVSCSLVKLLMTHPDVSDDTSRQHSVKVIFIRHDHCVCLVGMSCDRGYVHTVGIAKGIPANCPAQDNIQNFHALPSGPFEQTDKHGPAL